MVEPARIRILNDRKPREADYVLYWMQASVRAVFNPALEYAIGCANERNLPTIVCFGLMDDYPEANARHYLFLLQGLADTAQILQKRGIAMIVRHGHPAEVAIRDSRCAAMLVCDRGYLRHQKRWREHVADEAACQVVEIESDVVVPVDIVSDNAEFAARTIRPKIHRHWNTYLKPLRPTPAKHRSLSLIKSLRQKDDIEPSNPIAALNRLKVDRSVPPVDNFVGGHTEARRRLRIFLRTKLAGFAIQRSNPTLDHTSTLSPYLHFGNISPVEIALAVRQAKMGSQTDRDVLCEELIVRRELAINYCNFYPHYDRYEGLPDWARKTLAEHRRDKRDPFYTRAQLERAETYDSIWNDAQHIMISTGYMHNYLRMYWGKKILEWSRSPEEAYATMLYLNNKYFLDGRDPNSYANVGWIFGLHDRPWGPARQIFGLIRYMNAAGLKRKFGITPTLV